MQTGTPEQWSRARSVVERVWRFVEQHWMLVALLLWLGYCIFAIAMSWGRIRGFSLGDTDDNMRMSQVRALLAGQDWFDLRQYKMNPPIGANIHWSRIVDLPIAGLILGLRPLLGGPNAERWAAAVAPLLPLLATMLATAFTTRQLVARGAYPLALVALFFAGSTLGMYAPTRIDHHGWQLALLMTGVAGIVDPRSARGGLILGLSSAMSLSIGLEMIIYIALGGVMTVLGWVQDSSERRRMATFAASLGGGCALGFGLFASYANRLPVCDALSPVWLSDALIAGALLLFLSLLRIDRWKMRFGLAAVTGVIVAGFHALMWPHCLGRLEGVSPEVARLWLSHVSEARPVWTHGWQFTSLIFALPAAGVAGYAMLGWRYRRDPERLRPLLATAMIALAAGALLLWQTRTGPAAQMLAVPGAITLAWLLAPWTFSSKSSVVRVLGTSAVVLLGFGALVPTVLNFVPDKPTTPRDRAIKRANALCPTLAAMRPVALLPKGVVFTFIDLAPRLITVTHHSSIAGPYHRNGDQIADVMHAFRGTADQAHAIIDKYHSTYLLTCPGMSQSTIFMAETPKGFYGQLARGKVPAWLRPIALPKDNPLRIYRVAG